MAKSETVEYQGIAIRLPAEDTGFMFRVLADNDPGAYEDHATMAGAKTSIDAMHEAKAAADLALPVVLDDGTEATITGINRQNGHFLGFDEKHAYWVRGTYHPRAADMAAQLDMLREAADDLERRLIRYRLPRTTGHQTAEAHMAALGFLRSEYERIEALPDDEGEDVVDVASEAEEDNRT